MAKLTLVGAILLRQQGKTIWREIDQRVSHDQSGDSINRGGKGNLSRRSSREIEYLKQFTQLVAGPCLLKSGNGTRVGCSRMGKNWR